MIRVAACQVAIDIDDPAGTAGRLDTAIAEAAARGAQLVVLPELAPCGYVFADRAEALRCAEPAPDGPTLRHWCDLSGHHGIVVVGGFCELAPDGRLFNSAALVENGTVRAVYRKAHLWDTEKAVFTPGSQPPPVVTTAVGRVGMVVCYDLEFPEWVRLAAAAGAQIVAAPTNWPHESRPAGERPMEVVRVQAAASVNRVFIVAADRCATERGVDWVGGSVVVGPSGYPLAGPAAGEPLVLVADLDPAVADDKSISERNDVVADRRPELYGT